MLRFIILILSDCVSKIVPVLQVSPAKTFTHFTSLTLSDVQWQSGGKGGLVERPQAAECKRQRKYFQQKNYFMR
jgi:hypothetical protein